MKRVLLLLACLFGLAVIVPACCCKKETKSCCPKVKKCKTKCSKNRCSDTEDVSEERSMKY